MELISASRFSLQELTEAYNQTRVDYIVPMPMNIARLREYIYMYDVDLTASWVAQEGKTIFGLGMLGARDGRAWITRVGVLPWGRRQGIGRSIIDRLIQSADERGLSEIWLEVIKGNEPAIQLFLGADFHPTRELLVARRPPDNYEQTNPTSQSHTRSDHVIELDRAESLKLLQARSDRANWLNETETYAKISDLGGLYVKSKSGLHGWVCYEAKFLQLSRIAVEIVEGDVVTGTKEILETLHHHHPIQDAILENLPAEAPTWPGFEAAGYFDVFRRLEMVRSSRG